MRMIDFGKKTSLKSVGLYLSIQEAEQLKEELTRLLENPEANEHFHIDEDNYRREISCSIITEKKLENIKSYSNLEQKILLEK